MKNLRDKMTILAAGLLLACLLPISANAQDWQTSTMHDINSGFTPSVTDVGAETTRYIPMTSTSPLLPADATSGLDEGNGSISGPNRAARREFDTGGENGRDDEFPVGEPWVLLVFAACGAAVIAARRRQRA